MNKTLKLALSAVLGVALVTPALAQDQFSDVPENHWAYQALVNLKDKVLFGYPDGFFRGPRMTSRYEMAVALDKMWKLMMAQFDGVNAKVAALEAAMGQGGSDAALAKQVADLRKDVDAMKGWGTAINDMKRLTAEFEPQLKQLGVDVKAMKDEMSDMDERLRMLEEKETAIKIGAEVNLLILAGHNVDGNFGLTTDGRIVGEGAGSYAGQPVQVYHDVNVYHDAYITLAGGKDGEPQWDAVLLVGNLFEGLGGLGSNQANFGTNFQDDSDTTMGFGRFAVTFNSALAGQGFKAQIGRIGQQVGPYLFQRTSFTKEYYQQAWRDNGDWTMDGAILDFMFGAVNLQLFGGRNSDRNLNSGGGGVDINPIAFGAGTVDRTLGAKLSFPLNDMGGINLAYLWHDSDTIIPLGGNSNRLSVYGADANLKFGNIQFHGAFSQSEFGLDNSATVSNDNTAWDVSLGYAGPNFGVKGGYRTVEPNFFAAGDWGRIGTWYNPTNVEGFNAMVYFTPSAGFKIHGNFEQLEGNQNGGGALNTNDKVTSIKVGVDYKLNNYLDLGLSYEDVKFDFNGAAADPFQRWYTLMLGYTLSSNSKLMFTYSYSDVDGKGLLGNNVGMPGTGRFQGGLFGTQLKISF